MQLIPCPWCGDRDETEYRFGVETGKSRPSTDSSSDAQWANYLYDRTNSKGWAQEYWCHDAGCGRWFTLTRNTVTHEIAAAEMPRLEEAEDVTA